MYSNTNYHYMLLICALGCIGAHASPQTVEYGDALCSRIDWLENAIWTCTETNNCLFTKQLTDIRWHVYCGLQNESPRICCPQPLLLDDLSTKEEQDAVCTSPVEGENTNRTCEKLVDCAFTKEIFLRRSPIFCGMEDDLPKLCCSQWDRKTESSPPTEPPDQTKSPPLTSVRKPSNPKVVPVDPVKVAQQSTYSPPTPTKPVKPTKNIPPRPTTKKPSTTNVYYWNDDVPSKPVPTRPSMTLFKPAPEVSNKYNPQASLKPTQGNPQSNKNSWLTSTKPDPQPINNVWGAQSPYPQTLYLDSQNRPSYFPPGILQPTRDNYQPKRNYWSGYGNNPREVIIDLRESLPYSHAAGPLECVEYIAEYEDITTCLNFTEILVERGEEANEQEFPHMELIGHGEEIDEIIWSCGSSFISDQYILSPAHCMKDNGVHMRWVFLGRLSIVDANPRSMIANLFPIAESIIHPYYKPARQEHDIAPHKLEKLVVFSAHIRPVCLIAPESMKVNPSIYATGWDKMEAALMKIKVQLFESKVCEEFFDENTRLKKGYNNENMVCVGNLKNLKSTCRTNSGGPLQMNLSGNGFKSCMWIQRGTIFIGSPFCGNKTPAVYTKVGHYLSWIQAIVWL